MEVYGLCDESVLKIDREKNPLLHQGIEPASVVCRLDTLSAGIHPHPIFFFFLFFLTLAGFFVVVFYSMVCVHVYNTCEFQEQHGR